MTSTVNSPCCPTMSRSHSSNSVGSEVDNGHLGKVLVEQRVERFVVGAFEPCLEHLQLSDDRRRSAAGLGAHPSHYFDSDWLQTCEDRIVRCAVAAPAEFLAHSLA